MSDGELSHRYSETHARYELDTYTASGGMRRSSGRSGDAPEWVRPIVDMGMLAGANLLKREGVLMWFDTDAKYGLIRYKFTNK